MVVDAVGPVIRIISAVLSKHHETRSLKEEVVQFREVLRSTRTLLQGAKEQIERDHPRCTSLTEPMKLIREAVEEGSQVLDECSARDKKKRLKMNLFSRTYLGMLEAAGSKIQHALTLLSASGVVVQGNIEEGLEEVHDKVETMKRMVQAHHSEVLALLLEGQNQEIRSLPDEIVFRMVEMGVVDDRQDASEQIRDIAENSQKLREEKAFADEQILQLVMRLSLTESPAVDSPPLKTSSTESVEKLLTCPLSLELMNDGKDEEIEGIRFTDYMDESQLEHVMSLVGRDLSEPYSSE